MYGASDTQCSWQDRPSFSTMTSLIASLSSDEQMLSRCRQLPRSPVSRVGAERPPPSPFLHGISVILERHPSIVNCTADPTRPELGPSLLHWAIENGCSSALLSKLLRAQCNLGLPKDSKGRTALSPALEHGKSAHMQVASLRCVPKLQPW
eukprot:4663608-Prymnesium_polylepis.1